MTNHFTLYYFIENQLTQQVSKVEQLLPSTLRFTYGQLCLFRSLISNAFIGSVASSHYMYFHTKLLFLWKQFCAQDA